MAKKPFDLDAMTSIVAAPPTTDTLPGDKKKPEETSEPGDNDDQGGKDPEAGEKPENGDGGKKEPEGKTKETDPNEGEEDVQVDSFLSKHYGEKYEIKSRKELDETLESIDSLIDQNDQMKKKLEEVGDAKPKFASDRHEKAFNFLKEIDEDKWGEGMETLANLWGMKVDEEKDSRKLLEEQFILNHTELSRSEAQFKFKKEFNAKYGDVNKEDFKDEEEYKDEVKLREISLKSDTQKARKFLKEKQEEFKVKPEDKAKSKEPEIDPVVIKAIATNSKEYEKELGQTSELVFSPTESEDDDFTHKFTDEQLKTIRAVSLNWVKNPAVYGKDGKLQGNSSPEELFKRVAYSLFGDEIVAKNYEHSKKVFASMRAEDISGKKPSRTAKTGGSTALVGSEEEQQEALIKAKKGQRKR